MNEEQLASVAEQLVDGNAVQVQTREGKVLDVLEVGETRPLRDGDKLPLLHVSDPQNGEVSTILARKVSYMTAASVYDGDGADSFLEMFA